MAAVGKELATRDPRAVLCASCGRAAPPRPPEDARLWVKLVWIGLVVFLDGWCYAAPYWTCGRCEADARARGPQ